MPLLQPRLISASRAKDGRQVVSDEGLHTRKRESVPGETQCHHRVHAVQAHAAALGTVLHRQRRHVCLPQPLFAFEIWSGRIWPLRMFFLRHWSAPAGIRGPRYSQSRSSPRHSRLPSYVREPWPVERGATLFSGCSRSRSIASSRRCALPESRFCCAVARSRTAWSKPRGSAASTSAAGSVRVFASPRGLSRARGSERGAFARVANSA